MRYACKGGNEAARELDIKAPVVIRLEGTNVELGRQILAESGLAFSAGDSMKEAGELVTRLMSVTWGSDEYSH